MWSRRYRPPTVMLNFMPLVRGRDSNSMPTASHSSSRIVSVLISDRSGGVRVHQFTTMLQMLLFYNLHHCKCNSYVYKSTGPSTQRTIHGKGCYCLLISIKLCSSCLRHFSNISKLSNANSFMQISICCDVQCTH